MLNDAIGSEIVNTNSVMTPEEIRRTVMNEHPFTSPEFISVNEDQTSKVEPVPVVNNEIVAQIDSLSCSNNEKSVNFEISFTKSNLELARETGIYPAFSKFSNEIFKNIFSTNKNDDITGEFLLDSVTGTPTEDKMKWESAYALQQLNFGLNSNHTKFINRTIKDCQYTYYYDSNGDGNFEHEITFDKDNKAIYIKVVNKSSEYTEIESIENIGNTVLKISTKECVITEDIQDMHSIEAGLTKVNITYDENGKVASMECYEEAKNDTGSEVNNDEITPMSCILSASTEENNVDAHLENHSEDDLASLAMELNCEKQQEVNIIED